MDSTPTFSGKARVSPLDKAIEKSKPRNDVSTNWAFCSNPQKTNQIFVFVFPQQISLSAFAYLFSELVQYCEHRVQLVSELQSKLSEIGYNVGQRIVDIMMIREKNYKRETRLINMLIFIRSKVWIQLFGKEADKLEQANDDKNTCKFYNFDHFHSLTKFLFIYQQITSSKGNQ